jgi:hypothetical protein
MTAAVRQAALRAMLADAVWYLMLQQCQQRGLLPSQQRGLWVRRDAVLLQLARKPSYTSCKLKMSVRREDVVAVCVDLYAHEFWRLCCSFWRMPPLFAWLLPHLYRNDARLTCASGCAWQLGAGVCGEHACWTARAYAAPLTASAAVLALASCMRLVPWVLALSAQLSLLLLLTVGCTVIGTLAARTPPGWQQAGQAESTLEAYAERRGQVLLQKLAEGKHADGLECFCCMDRPVDAALPCGHVMCSTCAARTATCFKCRAPYARPIKLYF